MPTKLIGAFGPTCNLGALDAYVQAPGGGPVIGQMMITAANFCPRGWYQADGQLLTIPDSSIALKRARRVLLLTSCAARQ
jgi:Phage Tail Collar Domain